MRACSLTSSAVIAVLLVAGATASPGVPQQSRLSAGQGEFLLDGRPLQVLSGEMHYPRIPREYWRDRFRMARAMGLNTISTYVFWNLHEVTPGVFDFAGGKDVAAFVREAAAEGLHVIVRPGPYVCAEWELGGYPAWLFAEPGIVLRSTDPRFTRPAERWLERLGRELAPLQSDRGGPVIAIQVENEYGSFDSDAAYMRWQRDALRAAGFTGAMLFTADGGPQLPRGTLPDLPAVVNFGVGGAQNAFTQLQAFRPDGPLMTGEYWAGWFDHWGRPHAQTDFLRQRSELAWMVEQGHSLNLYMFHGGTTFGFMNGANIDNGRYWPQTSSYDYDAALSESGRVTRKFHEFRRVLAARAAAPLPPVPEPPAPMTVPPFEMTGVAPLWDTLGTPVRVERPRSMETFGQSYGYILYRTTVAGPVSGDLVITAVRDYARVFVDGAPAGVVDRRLDQSTLAVEIPGGAARLDILVENLGRVNFAKPLRDERKGITESVRLNGRELTGWDVYTLPMSATPAPAFREGSADGPAFYRGAFELAATRDTFLDTRGWGKGTVWVNGHHLGRFWDIGPQQTLYVPAPWLRIGRNDVVLFTLDVPTTRTLAGLGGAVFTIERRLIRSPAP